MKSTAASRTIAPAYAVARLAEAYGLWHDHAWAEWFGALSGGLYLPFEVRLLLHGFTMLRFAVVVCNLIIVAYLVRRIQLRRREPHSGATHDSRLTTHDS